MSEQPDLIDLKDRMGPVGVWSFGFDRQPAARERELIAEVEGLGYPAVWIAEGLWSKEALSHAGLLLDASRRVVLATGIASMWARDPVAMANGSRALNDDHPGRFVLGLGVSHRTSVERRSDGPYRDVLERMERYLEAMDQARYPAREAGPQAPRVLAALGPKMLRLARDHAAGAHTYFVPVEHTAFARETLGPEPFLAPELAVVLDPHPERARTVAREYMSHYLKLENYAKNLKRFGWTEEDIAANPDRLVDAIVAWGDEGVIRERVRAHLAAGADHVCVQVLTPEPAVFPVEELRRLAPVLLE